MNYCCFNIEEVFSDFAPVFVIMFALFALFVVVVVIVIKAVIFCRIFSRAGYHWALGLLMLVPVACIIMPFILAFGHWPIYKELEQLRRQLNLNPDN